ncbi:hypothetical protein BASA81_011042 [Batrachochytrium salamandrivorans]|nr:hypothetical protein BASA81_011042 [Batrachochytrium salamandrivorans]
MLSFVANTLLSAAQDVAQELNKSTAPISRHSLCVFDGRLVLCGLPARNPEPQQHGKELHPLRSMQPFDGPENLKLKLDQTFPRTEEEEEPVYFTWNLSGMPWDASFCEVIEYDFPSRPIPPLAALVEICKAMHQFLEANPRHIAIVHDLSGRRSAVVVACVLVLRGKGLGALDHVCAAMGNVGNALVASQRRYFAYFCEQHSSSEVRQVALKRIIVNGVPNFTNHQGIRCEPYFKAYDALGKELGGSDKQVVSQNDASFVMVPKTSNVPLQGDILVRVFSGEGNAMFAFAFHTSFLEMESGGGGGVLRLALDELDGTLNNKRFPQDMFVDLVFGGQVLGFEQATKPDVMAPPPPPPVVTLEEEEASLWKEIDDVLQEGGGEDQDDEEEVDFDDDLMLK